MRLPDPGRSRAVLIGSSRYAGMEDLPAVAANLTRLARLLRDPEVWGLPAEHVAVVAEPASPGTALDEIQRAAAGAGDTLIVYYAGHGLLDDDDNLLLALPGTDIRRPYTAIRFDDLRTQVRRANRNSAKVIILDCCYSARAIAGGMSPDPLRDGTVADDLKRHAAVDGTYLMAAAAETKIAVAPPGETYTAFTGELIKVLEEGIDGSPDLITVDQIFWQIRGELEAKGRPRPEQGTRNEGATIVLSRNRARRRHGTVPDPRPPETVAPPGLPSSSAALIAEVQRPGADADTLLRTAGAVMPDQQVAGLVLRLDDRDTAKVLAGAAGRPLHEIQAVLGLLRTLGATPKVDLLLRQVAAGSPQRTVELAAALAETDGGLSAVLLAHAVAVAAGDHPHWVIELVAGLSRRGLKDAADAVVAEAVVRLRGPHAAEVADALREAGRDADAARLYATALPVLARRGPEQIAAVGAELIRQGLAGAARKLVGLAAEQSGTAREQARLLGALAADPALAGLRSALVDAFGGGFDQRTLRELAGEIGANGGDPVEIYVAAAGAQPVEVVLGLLGHVLDQDRVRDAVRLVEWAAAERPAEDLVRIGCWLAEPYRTGLVQRMLAGVTGVPPVTLVRAYLLAKPVDDGLTAAVTREMRARPPAERLGLAIGLAAAEEVAPAVRLLTDLADPGDLEEGDRLILLTSLATAPPVPGLLIRLAAEQIRSGGSTEWSLAVMPPEMIDAAAGAVDDLSFWRYLRHRPAEEIVTVLDALREPFRLLRQLAQSPTELIVAVLLDMHRTGRDRLALELAGRFRESAPRMTAAEAGWRLRVAGAECEAQRFLERRT